MEPISDKLNTKIIHDREALFGIYKHFKSEERTPVLLQEVHSRRGLDLSRLL